MNAADFRIPLRVRLRCAARAAWACLRGDYTVQRLPVIPPPPPTDRQPGMCRTLSDCVQMCHQLEQTEAQLGELVGRRPRRG